MRHCSPERKESTLASIALKSATTYLYPGFGIKAVRINSDSTFGMLSYNRTGQRYVFSGKILCACCGRHYTRQLWKNSSTQRPTWTCTGKKAAKNRCTKSKNLSEKLLLNACCAAMQTEHFDQEKFEQNIEQIIAHEAGQLEFCFRGGRRVQISAQKAEKQGFLSP